MQAAKPARVAICDRCFDLGIWIGPSSKAFEPCPAIVVGNQHNEPTQVAHLIEHAVMTQNITADSHLFEIVRTLANYSTDYPCSREVLIEKHFSYITGSNETIRRAVSAAIERLREEWVMPIGSRRTEPFGYWIIIEEEDFGTWFDAKRSQPLTELRTLHRIAKRWFPVYAGQLELDLQDLETSALADHILEGE